jgi:hypothetical protein
MRLGCIRSNGAVCPAPARRPFGTKLSGPRLPVQTWAHGISSHRRFDQCMEYIAELHSFFVRKVYAHHTFRDIKSVVRRVVTRTARRTTSNSQFFTFVLGLTASRLCNTKIYWNNHLRLLFGSRTGPWGHTCRSWNSRTFVPRLDEIATGLVDF